MSCVALDEILKHNWGINRKSVEIQMKFSGVLFFVFQDRVTLCSSGLNSEIHLSPLPLKC